MRTSRCAWTTGRAIRRPSTACSPSSADREPAGELKIVTTAAMLLPRVRIDADEPLRLDNWQGYPASFHRMLAFICRSRAGGRTEDRHDRGDAAAPRAHRCGRAAAPGQLAGLSGVLRPHARLRLQIASRRAN